MKQKRSHVFRWVIVLVLVAIGVAIFLNRQWVYDFVRGKIYQPSTEMVAIRKSLDLTERGEFLFNATHPALNTNEEFNRFCRADDDEVAILGCYTGGNIYIYNIVEDELNGIRELTAAHELLHVNFARMSETEREKLRTDLEQVYKNNESVLREDLETYDEAERFEELYVRAGTEIKELPENLEKHYAEVFKDQDKIVAFYEGYISVFRAVEAELSRLTEEMEMIAAEVEAKTAEYKKRAAQLNADVISFNACAGAMGCFKSQSEFLEKRGSLVAEQNALEALYNEINNLIEQYNTKVEKYNENVVRSERLNEMINSNVKPEEL